MPSVTILSYTPSQLQEWNTELENNQLELTRNSAQISEYEGVITPLARDLQHVEQEIERVNAHLNGLLQTNTVLELLDYQHPNFGHPHYRPPQQASDRVRICQINEGERQLRTLNQEREQLIRNMQPYQRGINRLTQLIEEKTQRNQWVQQQVNSASLFIQALRFNPRVLVMELRDKLLTAINEYETHFFVKRSLQVRSSLFAIHKGLELLITDSFDPNIQRQNYLRLCGFLADLYSRVQREDKDKDFLDCLAGVINTTHVNPQDDLFDGLGTSYSATSWYDAVKRQNQGILAITELALHGQEVLRLQQLMDDLLHPYLTRDTDLRGKIEKAARLMDMEIADKVHRNELVDFHFYISMAESLMQLHNEPTDTKAAERLFFIAEHATGASSMSRKVLGSLLLVLGCLVIGGSIFAFVSTMGSSSLLSTWGMALGFNIIQMQAAISASCSLTTAIGAGLSFWGIRTISRGMHQGLSQELTAVVEAASDEVVDYPLPTTDELPPVYSQPIYM